VSNTVQVKILGRDYTLRSQQTAEQVQKIADFVEEMIAETAAGRAVDTQDLTVLTLLNLAGQYLQLREGESQERQELQERLEQLIVQLEAVNSGC